MNWFRLSTGVSFVGTWLTLGWLADKHHTRKYRFTIVPTMSHSGPHPPKRTEADK